MAWCVALISMLAVLAQAAPPDIPGEVPFEINPSVVAPRGLWVTYAQQPAGASMSAQAISLPSCIMRAVHTHACDEMFVLRQGRVQSYVVENGTTTMKDLEFSLPGTLLYYPAGQPHFQYNPNCAPASYMAVFNAPKTAIKTFNYNASILPPGVPPMFVEIATRGVLAMPLFYDGAEVGDVIDTDCAARCAGMGGGTPAAGGPYTVAAGGSVILDASGANCTNGPCTYGWTVTCNAGKTTKKSGATAVIKAGPSGDSPDISTEGLKATTQCQVALVVTDSANVKAAPVFSTLAVTVAPPRCGGGDTVILTDGKSAKVSDLASERNVRAESKTLVCNAKRDIRRGKPSSAVTTANHSISIRAYKDPQGNAVTTRILGVLANDAETPCSCTASKADNCSCVADARVASEGSSALLMPMTTASSGGSKAPGGRQYVVKYEARSEVTGLACQGEALVCVTKWPRSNTPEAERPACAAYDPAKPTRDATKCGA